MKASEKRLLLILAILIAGYLCASSTATGLGTGALADYGVDVFAAGAL
jgi:hypothetical protein